MAVSDWPELRVNHFTAVFLTTCVTSWSLTPHRYTQCSQCVCYWVCGGGALTRLGVHRLLVLLGGEGPLLEALGGGDGGPCVQPLHPHGAGLEPLGREGPRLQALGPDLGRLQADAVHRHQLHGVEVDRGGHAHAGGGRQGGARGLRGHWGGKGQRSDRGGQTTAFIAPTTCLCTV